MFKNVLTMLSNKVDKVSGKGLSTNDFTDDLKQKLDDIGEGSFLPSGGTTGQVLAKASSEDGDVEWVEQTGGGTIVNSSNVDVATFSLTQNQTFEITTSWEAIKINFDTIDCKGDKLCLQDNKIIVGKGISKVLVSANISITEAMTGVVQLHIRKNGSIIGKRSLNYKNETYFNLIATPQPIDVEEGDEISLTIMPSSVQTEKTIRADATYMTIVAIQDGQNECVSDIVISPTEPQTDRRKVWFQKGKNIVPTDFDMWESGQYNANAGYEEIMTSRIKLKSLIEVKNNTSYYFNTFNDNYKFVIRAFDKNGTFIKSVGAVENGSIITIGSDIAYVGIIIYNPSDETLTYEDYKSLFEDSEIKPFICYDSETDKKYEPYVNPTIYVKNDNGTYEEFIKKEEQVKTITNSNGTAILYPNGIMVCTKKISLTGINVNNPNSSLYVSSNIALGNFAKSFFDMPVVNSTIYNGVLGFIYRHDNFNESSVGTVVIARSESTTNAYYNIAITAIGRWK